MEIAMDCGRRIRRWSCKIRRRKSTGSWF